MIHRTLTLAGLCLLTAACGGGIDSYDDATGAQLDLKEELVGILEDVTDGASAKAAVPDIERVGRRMKEVADQMAKLPPPSMEESVEVRKKYAARIRETQQETMEHMMKLGQYPELSRALNSAMSGGR